MFGRYVEVFEARVLFSAKTSVPTFNPAALLGYTRPGASYTYDSTYSISTKPKTGINKSGTGTSTISVLPDRTNKGVNYDVVTQVDGKTTSTLGIRKAKGGAVIAFLQAGVSGTQVKFDISGNVAIPTSQKLGTTVSNSGSFSAKVDLSRVLGGMRGDSATYSGKATVTTQLLEQKKQTVPAGDFNCVHGKLRLTLSGSFSGRAWGESASGPFSIELSQDFYADQVAGVVSQNASLKASISAQGESLSAVTKVNSWLTSFNTTGG